MERLIRNMSRHTKSALWLITDAILAPISLYLAYALRLENLRVYQFMQSWWVLLPLLAIAAMGFSYVLRLHRVKLHAFDDHAIRRVGIVSGVLVLVVIVSGYLFEAWVPRSVPFIFGIVFCLAAVATRLLALAVVKALLGQTSDRRNVAIYGAGAAGIQLASALQRSPDVRPVAFIDDNSALWGLLISGIPVRPLKHAERMIAEGTVQSVLLAMPSIARSEISRLTERLRAAGAKVEVVPSYAELLSGRHVTETTVPVPHDALLGRDRVDLDIPDVAETYTGRTVMVTGAGGSIGAELCRQLVDVRPAVIVLFERSEFALYAIDKELRALAIGRDVRIITRLGSVIDTARVRQVISETQADIVMHAAAYKHVPIVEENELEGARNNVIGTRVVAQAAVEAGVERFTLISTDKAVRPTNIMGATKRLAEQIVQDAQRRTTTTKLSMVRFGNVLGSSGSVLPLFEQQIRRGGPLTVTHPDVTRFFMTIPEAARLVLLAGAYAEGGDTFVLDMGKPMRILDIAKRMIELSGRTVRENGQGDIEIEITGLRPGEKLFEELLIDDDSLVATPHTKILRAREDAPSSSTIERLIDDLERALSEGDTAGLRRLIERHVDGYHRPDR